jgi:hypothetical protein
MVEPRPLLVHDGNTIVTIGVEEIRQRLDIGALHEAGASPNGHGDRVRLPEALLIRGEQDEASAGPVIMVVDVALNGLDIRRGFAFELSEHLPQAKLIGLGRSSGGIDVQIDAEHRLA